MTMTTSRRLASATVLICLGTLVFGALWASIATIDQVSRASGHIIPAGRVQIVQVIDGGTIVRILVREGDRVQHGHPLIELDQRQQQAQLEDIKAKVAALQVTNYRIEAELLNRPLKFPNILSAYPIFIDNQTRLFERRVNSQNQAVAALSNIIRIANKAYDEKKLLVDQALALRPDLLSLERVLADAQAQLSARVDRYLEDLQTEYAKNGEELVTAEQILVQREAMLDNTIIRAPTSGIVRNLNLTTLGGVFRPGDEALQIVPTGEHLIVEAKLQPSEISYVRLGQMASVKFDAYDSSVFGAATGTIIYVSPDTLAETYNGVENRFYRVHLKIDISAMHLHNGVAVDLRPGMTSTVEIKGEQNTVLNFLLKPMTRTIADSFGER